MAVSNWAGTFADILSMIMIGTYLITQNYSKTMPLSVSGTLFPRNSSCSSQ